MRHQHFAAGLLYICERPSRIISISRLTFLYLTQREWCISCSVCCEDRPRLRHRVALSPGGCRTAAAEAPCPPSERSPSRPRKKRTWRSPGNVTRTANGWKAELRGRNPERIQTTLVGIRLVCIFYYFVITFVLFYCYGKVQLN